MESQLLEEMVRIRKTIELAFPSPDNVDANTDGSVTLTAGQSATITFTLEKGYDIIVHAMYCDFRAVSSYEWVMPAKSHNISVVDYAKPHKLSNPDPIILIISNGDTVSHTYNYYLKARAIRQGAIS